VTKGVRQGDPCSGILFEIYLDGLTDCVSLNRITSVKLEGRNVFLLKFADDVVEMSEDLDELQISLDRTSDYSKGRNLLINYLKCFVMVAKGHSHFEIKIDLVIDGVTIKQVKEFRYLGLVINEQFNLNKTSQHQEQKIISAYFSLISKINSLKSEIPFKIDEQMFKATVISVANFGVEIFGPSKIINQYRLKFFQKLFNLKNGPPCDSLYWINGFLPTTLRQTALQINFVKKMLKRSPDSLLYLALVESVQVAKERKTA